MSGAILVMLLPDKYLYCMHKSWANQHKCTQWRGKDRESEREREREKKKTKGERERERESRRTYNCERAVKPVKVPDAILIMLLLDHKPNNIHLQHGVAKR